MLVICRAFFLIHCRALLLVFNGALLVLMLCADTFMTYRALMHIHSVAQLLHLWLAFFLFNSTALLVIRGAALVLVGSHCLVLSVAVLVLLLGHVPSIRDGGHKDSDHTSKETDLRNIYLAGQTTQDLKLTQLILELFILSSGLPRSD